MCLYVFLNENFVTAHIVNTAVLSARFSEKSKLEQNRERERSICIVLNRPTISDTNQRWLLFKIDRD